MSNIGIHLVIFSRDRAFQLDGLLSSLAVNCDIFSEITVIYKSTSFDYGMAYFQLRDEYLDVKFIKETDFKRNVIKAMGGEYVCFMVDDMIAFQPISECREPIPSSDEVCFSLRLKCGTDEINGSYRYKWREEKTYKGYPFSVDGHIFKTSYMLQMVTDTEYNSPNKLEIALNRYKNEAPPFIACCREATVVSIPINRVSDTASASFGEKYPYTVKELNEKFLSGYRMDWEMMDFRNIKLPHQEVDIIFKEA